jgi:peptide/nickel transport system substrate-binding protein
LQLVIGSAADINNLDLQAQQDQINNIVLKTTHQTLVYFTNKGTFEPNLATSWEFKDDTHIIFHLDPRAKFNDGSPLTADDVKFTMDRAMKSYVANNLAGLVATTVVDPHTVEMEIETYNNEFVQSLASVPVSILSKKAYESGMKEPYHVGSGPYMFDSWVQGEYCKVVKNPNYWREDSGVSDAIVFKPILEDSSRVIALQTGEIDVCINPPINELQFLQDDKNVTVFEKPGSRLFYFAFNVTQKPWDNEKLRQAVACAIDRDSVLQVAVYGKGTPQKTILNRGLWGFYDDMEGFPYDVARAKKLMAEAGYPNGGIKTTLLIANSSPYINIAQVIQANLKEIGIEVAIQQVDDATLKATCKSGTQALYLWRWNEDSKVDFVYRDLFYTGSGSNYQHYSDKHADELVDLVATEKDQDKRMQDGIELQKYLVNACPQVPLYIANLVIAYNKNLKGEYLFGGGNHDWSHAYIAK